MRTIDADALWMDIIHSMDYCDDILEIIERQPTVQPEVIACGSGELKDESGTEWVSNAGMVQVGEMHAGVLRTIPIFGEDTNDE